VTDNNSVVEVETPNNEVKSTNLLKKITYNKPSGIDETFILQLITRFFDWAGNSKEEDVFYLQSELKELIEKSNIEIADVETIVQFFQNDIMYKIFDHSTKIVDVYILDYKTFQIQEKSETEYAILCHGSILDHCSYFIKIIKELLNYRKDKSIDMGTHWILQQLKDESKDGISEEEA
jgi:uncharacterized protein YkvS